MLTKTDIELVEIDGVSQTLTQGENTPQEKTKDTTSLEALFK